MAKPFVKAKVHRRVITLSSAAALEAAGVSLRALPSALPAHEADRWVVAVQQESADKGRCTLADIGG